MLKFSGECQLISWKKSSSKQPPTVTLAFSDDEDIDFFQKLTLWKKGMVGQILKVEISCDGEDLTTPAVPNNLPQRAYRLTKDPDFIRWCKETYNEDPDTVIKQLTGIDSKGELAHNKEAIHTFKKIEAVYLHWRRGNGR